MQSTLSYPSVKSSAYWPWIMLFSRIVLFFTLQALFALGYLLAGSSAAWEASAAWWPLTATLANVVCIVILVRLYRKDGQSYWSLFHFNRGTILKDTLLTLGLMLIGIPLAMFPNILLGQWLFGSSEAVLPLLFRPLALWVSVPALILFPLTIGLAELPTYFAYAGPRLETRLGAGLAVTLSALMLAAQHITLPLVFDSRFMAWRLLMFIPFAFFVGILLHWRPRLLPYFVIIHALLDLSAAWAVLAVSL